MGKKISAVLNTLNNKKDIKRAIDSVSWADEVILYDMQSTDRTVAIAKGLGAKIVAGKKYDYVELARNQAIAKASGDWILILDPDEEIPSSLKEKLVEIASQFKQVDYVRVPRKNIIFNNWMKASMWWPDLNIRFFKKGSIEWGKQIHRPPKTLGAGIDLPAEEKWAIIHHHYQSVWEFLERMQRYTKIQAEELIEEGYKFSWQDLIKKPVGEFLSRFFASKGFEDGLHGLALSLLQSFSFLIVYLRVWENEKFYKQEIKFKEAEIALRQTGKDIDYWLKYGNLSKNPIQRLIQKARNKL